MIISQLRSKDTLGDKLNENVKKSCDDECGENRARYGSRRLFYFSARHQGHLDADKSENQKKNSITEGFASWPAGPGQGFRPDKEKACDDENNQRHQFDHRNCADRLSAEAHTA